MKTRAFLFVFSFFFSGGVVGQVVDTLTIMRELDSLRQLCNDFQISGQFQQMLAAAKYAGDVVEKKIGKSSALYARFIFSQATALYYMGDYSHAELLHLEAKNIREAVLGKENRDYLGSLINLGNLYSRTARFPEAKNLYLESSSIAKRVFGEKSPYYFGSLINLGALYAEKGQTDTAEIFYLEAKTVQESLFGKNTADYALILNNLGNLYSSLARYTEAESELLEAKTIRELVLGKVHPDFAQTLQNLAILYQRMSRYHEAEPLLLESKNILEKTLGKENPDYAGTLDNLGILYAQTGRYKEAEMFYLEDKNIRGNILGKDHPSYASTLHHLAMLYGKMGAYSKSIRLCTQAKHIREKIFGKKNDIYTASLIDLGTLYINTGQLDSAEACYLEAKHIFEDVLNNRQHVFYFNCLYGLGHLYFLKGRYTLAESQLLEAKRIEEKVMGNEYPVSGDLLFSLGRLYEWLGQFASSDSFFEAGLAVRIKQMGKGAVFLSEKDLSDYLKTLESDGENLLVYTGNRFSHQEATGQLPSLAFNNTLFCKGFLLIAVKRLRQIATTDKALTQQFYLLQSYHSRLAREYTRPVSERQGVATLEEKANTLEKELIRTVAGFGDAIRQVNWQEVQAQLQPGEAALEFVDFHYSNPDPTDSILYAALLLRPGWEAPRFIPLFEQRQLNALLAAPHPETYLYTPAKRSIVVDENEAPTLYDLVWAPLDSLLEGVKTVYYSPSGLLHRLNFDALPVTPDKPGATLADHYALHRVNSTRELVIPTTITPAQQDAVVFGGIRYEMDSTAIRAQLAAKDSVLAPDDQGGPSFWNTDPQSRGGTHWHYLPGAEREAGEVGKLLTRRGFRTVLRGGYAATEESVKQIGRDGPEASGSPRVLHIATHGYFFPDPKDTLRHSAFSLVNDAPAFKISEHPMIRSGLILAGGNAAWTGQPTPAGLEDGILTAYEISQMNLRNTELVVLSACETGLGDIQGNEGVYGLQRAFKIAGAKYLLMSLWEIPDEQTRELMTLFYREYTGGKAIPEAFRAAQGAMRKRYPDKPGLWAGFILVE